MRVLGRRLAALLLVTGVGAAAACGSEPAAAVTDPEVDLAALDVGGYNTQPKEFQPKNRVMVARFFEAQRMAGFIPAPFEIDPSLRVNQTTTTHAFLEPEEGKSTLAMHTFLKSDGFNSDTKGFVAGFASTGQTDDDPNIGNALSTSVLLFESDSAATAAAAALSVREFQEPYDRSPNVVETLKSAVHANAVVRWQPSKQALAAWYSTGRYVIVTIAQSEENRVLKVSDKDLLLNLADKSITATSDRLRSFQPTPVDQLATMELDPTGMYRRTLWRTSEDYYHGPPGVYSLAGDLHLMSEPAELRAQYDEAGVDAVSWGATRVIRAKDIDAAQRLREQLSYDKYFRTAAGPAALPSARCATYVGPSTGAIPNYCWVSRDRYVAMAWGEQMSDVQQRISAQYALLVNSR
ncbi:hypothetical protein H0264_06085 [Nocardia huaxiensis]|uniref:Uncharacterized protein n=1 Tax=Nocardia huaxiensis TaxID=2755382 RepID=A0A7D6VBY0_9NOCA|nr:hypothetical protein [Nocardia huaxiensis]QLY31874.1 hypothetical protein H0264_06085 [Nocardia huaxiensis]